jgi:hypothetical protein
MLVPVNGRAVIATVCAWCSAPMGRRVAAPGFERNFGMCRACLSEQLARLAPAPKPRTRSLRARVRVPAQPSAPAQAASP